LEEVKDNFKDKIEEREKEIDNLKVEIVERDE